MTTTNEAKPTAMPSEEEVRALLREAKGTAHVWQALRAKYGDPKGKWGSFVYALMIQSAAKPPKHDGAANNPIHNLNQSSANDAKKLEISSRNPPSLEDLPYPLSCAQYLRIISDIAYLENDLRMLTSLVTAMLARSRSMRYRD